MNTMKKVLIILGVILALVVLAMISIPILYKDRIVERAKSEVNKNLNATLDFEDVDLNLFEHFPHFTLHIERVRLINHPPFEGDTLVSMSAFETTLDLGSILRGKTTKVVSVSLDAPRLHLLVSKDKVVNWDVVRKKMKKAPEPKARRAFSLALQDYEIKKGYLAYEDQSSGLRVTARNLGHSGRGDFTQDRFGLRTRTHLDDLSIEHGGRAYVHSIHLGLNADMEVNGVEKKLVLRQNELQLNEVSLRLDGSIGMVGEGVMVNVSFQTNTTEFRDILSLIPAMYTRDFADINTSGHMALQGYLQGVYRGDQFPAFDVQLSVRDGMVQPSKLPAVVGNVNLDFAANSPGGPLDRAILHLKRMHAEVNGEPFDANLLVKTPVSDPYIAATMKGRIDLHAVRNLIAIDQSVDMAGTITSDVLVEGHLSSFRKHQYRQYQAQGTLALEDIRYSAPEVPQPIAIKHAHFSLTPEQIRLRDLEATLGESDIQAQGTLEQVLPYLLTDQTLRGTLVLHSRFFDLTPWMRGRDLKLRAMEVPDGIDFTLNSTFQEVLLSRIRMEDVRGIILLRGRTLHLMDLDMKVLNGSLVANGTYSKPKAEPAHSFFRLAVENLSIGQTFERFLTVQKLVPIAQNIQGDMGGDLEIVTDLDSTLTPIWNTLNSRGALTIRKAMIEDYKPLTMAADLLKMDQLRKFTVEDIHPSFSIRDGRFHLAPLGFRINHTDGTVSGSNGLDRSLDYVMKLRVPAKELKDQTHAVLERISGRHLDLLPEDSIVLDVLLRGTVDKPDVRVSAEDIVKGAADQLTRMAQQIVQEQKAVLEDTVRAEIQKQKRELEQLKREAEKRAQSEVERLRKEAESKLKKILR